MYELFPGVILTTLHHSHFTTSKLVNCLLGDLILDFIRAEGYVFSHVADEGWMDSCAGELLRYRKFINAENVLVLTDIKKKHL